MPADNSSAAPSAYAQAGVDIEAGDRAVELMKASVKRATRPEVLGGLGGFAGLFDATALTRYRHPVLTTSTDGVGTKVAIAKAMGVYDTIGWDLVGMVADDIVVVGAEPLFMTDYIACGKVFPERIAAIVSGVADACAANGIALVGGETAEHPGLMAEDDFDIAGAVTGVVEQDALLGPDRVLAGDVVLAIASSGLHSNGYSLVRRVLLGSDDDARPDGSVSGSQKATATSSSDDRVRARLSQHIDELGRTLGEELLEPTRVYTASCLAVTRACEVHAMSHVTGGGFAGNLARVLPGGLGASIDRATWTPPAIFGLVQRVGGVSQPDLEAALNMGVGMALVLPESSVDEATRVLAEHNTDAWVCGHIDSTGTVSLTGHHRGR